jgi:hypothetical protein
MVKENRKRPSFGNSKLAVELVEVTGQGKDGCTGARQGDA